MDRPTPPPYTTPKPRSEEVVELPLEPIREDPSGNIITLNPDDPFEKVLIDIVKTNRRKQRDYSNEEVSNQG